MIKYFYAVFCNNSVLEGDRVTHPAFYTPFQISHSTIEVSIDKIVGHDVMLPIGYIHPKGGDHKVSIPTWENHFAIHRLLFNYRQTFRSSVSSSSSSASI